jgi:D-arabinose 1-dehydrogenase-like Zn-dependent alcohol dehydrogenase
MLAAMTTMRAVQISRPGGPFELVERPIPAPGPGTVRLKVEACGVCHSDALIKEGPIPIAYPRVPGHEVAGVVDAVGAGVTGWTVGQRAGVGWNGGFCGVCAACRRGDLFACVTKQVTGLTFDGGYADYMLAPASALAAIPAELTAVEAAPLMCAGITTFNALRNAGARPGDLVAVLGLGGLGHLGVQFAAKMGFRTVAIARGPEKAALAQKLGASSYIDSKAGDPAAALTKLGGAKVVLATVTDGDAMAATVAGLAANGTLMVLGGARAMAASPGVLLGGRRSIKGWYSGTAADSEDTMSFSALTGVRSMNEVYPLEKVTEAYDRMMSGGARFRAVLTMAAAG